MPVLGYYNPTIHDVYTYPTQATRTSGGITPTGYNQSCQSYGIIDWSGTRALDRAFVNFYGDWLGANTAGWQISIDPENVNFWNQGTYAVIMITPRHAVLCEHFRGPRPEPDNNTGGLRLLGKNGTMTTIEVERVYLGVGGVDMSVFLLKTPVTDPSIKIYTSIADPATIPYGKTMWKKDSNGKIYKTSFKFLNRFDYPPYEINGYVDDPIEDGVNDPPSNRGVVAFLGDSGSPTMVMDANGNTVFVGMEYTMGAQVINDTTFAALQEIVASEGYSLTRADVSQSMPINRTPTIQTRLLGTDVNSQVNWLQKNGTIYHDVPDPLYSSLSQSPIQNPIPKAKQFYIDYNGVGSIRSNETADVSTGGAFFIGDKVAETMSFNAVDDRATIDLKPLMSDFMTARSQGGKTFAILLHGKQDPFPVDIGMVPENSESKYFRGAGEGAIFDVNFYKKSSWLSFHSRESTMVQVMSETTSVSFRKNFHHGLLKLDSSKVAGISQGFSMVYIKSFGQFNWNNASGLSAGALVTFNEKTTPVNEITNATRNNTTPTIISCTNKTLRFMGVNGNTASFQVQTTTPFSSQNSSVETKINWGDLNYADSTTQPYSIDQADTSLTLRCRYSGSYGTDNLLALSVSLGSKRFFGGTDNIGITAGSYIEITGASIASNNGIYRVEAVFDGVPEDSNYLQPGSPGDLNADGAVNASDLAIASSNEPFSSEVLANVLNAFGSTNVSSYQPYQYLRLSRSIIPEEGSRMTIRNVSNLPILHVKYTQVVTP